MKITLDPCEVVFKMYCNEGIIKTYKIAYEECEELSYNADSLSYPNQLVCPSSTLLDCLSNFAVGQEEVSLEVRQNKISLCNYVNPVDVRDAGSVTVDTKLRLDCSEFERYDIKKPTKVIFCSKEI